MLLGNDFLQQFQDYHQTLYMISLKTPCGHFIKVPRKQNPYNLERDDKGNIKRKYLENLRKLTCKCLNLEKIKENLQKSYGENPLEKWNQSHERAILTLKDPSQKYIKELLSKKLASGSTYQKGSMDEILIQKFLEKQNLKENLEDNHPKLILEQKDDTSSKLKEKEDE